MKNMIRFSLLTHHAIYIKEDLGVLAFSELQVNDFFLYETKLICDFKYYKKTILGKIPICR